jgi:uncharacterized protein
MLIEFSVGNYKSFKEQVTFSLVAANLVAKDKALDGQNTHVVDGDLTLLKSAAIYGANASGKSNLAKALGFMKQFMVNSSKETQSTDGIPVDPFRLSAETENQPSYFELVFLMAGQKYRYGFEVDRTRVVTEWLYYVPKTRETKLFTRELNDIKTSKSYGAEGVQQRTRDNALFLSVSAQFNVAIATSILDWITQQMVSISGINSEDHMQFTIDCLLAHRNESNIRQLIKKLDLGIDEIQIRQEGRLLGTRHRKFDGDDHGIVDFELQRDESEGSRKVFALAGPITDTLQAGKVLVIDEFDASLHPLISRHIIGLFNSNETNPNNAQLIVMTHDSNLLSNKIFRRDQIWFTEKDRYGATDLYSLAEYNVRNDASFENDYIKGKYGAIPYLGDLNSLVSAHGF